MSEIKAIQTRHGDCFFRSRLEARWSIFLTESEIEWEYEPEGFELNKEWYGACPEGVPPGPYCYLPDFWLPQVSMWAEVKRGWPTPKELAVIGLLADCTGYSVLILDGKPRADSWFYGIDGLEFNHGSWDLIVDPLDICEGHKYWTYESRFYSEWGGHAEEAAWNERPQLPDNDWTWRGDFVHQAVTAALSARFERDG
tara:strand:+ start:29211 stop:29804 length:594 start_codon:yes stop_codon:yes gene_type:complete